MKTALLKTVVLTTDHVMHHYNMMFDSNYIQVHEFTNYYEHFPYLIKLDDDLFDKKKYLYFDLDKFCYQKNHARDYELTKKCTKIFKEQYALLNNFKNHLTDKEKSMTLNKRLNIINQNKDFIIYKKVQYEVSKQNDVNTFINANTDIYIQQEKNPYKDEPLNQWISFAELISLCVKQKYKTDIYVYIKNSDKNKNIIESINIVFLNNKRPVISIVNTSDNFIHHEKFLSYKLLYVIFEIIENMTNTPDITNNYVYSINFDAQLFDYNLVHNTIPTNEFFIEKSKIINSLPDIELINIDNKIKEIPVITSEETIIKNKLF